MTPPISDRLFRLWTFVLASFVVLVAGSAYAQDGGVLPSLVDDPLKAITTTAESIATGEWWMAASAVVSLLTWVFRSGVLKKLPTTGALAFLGRAGTWLTTNPIASLATPFVLSAALAALTTFANGTPFTLNTLLSEVLKIGAGAVATFIAVEKVKEAKNAGTLAAAGITTQQEALDELTKRVLKGPPAPPAA